ncbi:hypothetical protein WN51_00122 [Melipona quadrifasciata]|uniref:DUF7041 domain-containing protein n=1 Tax=Melipona quadrifasciata TaxID=166423 RepID=A0A0N0BL10_9HYME|nr:hypothetical protein WN51_00122 [Melipona quadrifasciata]
MEEAHIPSDSKAPAISAVVPQYFPPFDKENPKLWFLQVEAALRTSRITNDSSRFDYIIQRLPADVSRLLENILETPPASNKYETLKNKFLELFGKSEETRVRQLLRTCRMGDEKPSHFLQRMRSR